MTTLSDCHHSRIPATSDPPDPVRAMGSGGYEAFKAAADFILAALISILTLPLMIAAMVVVRLTSRGPAIYSQTRVGLRGRPFTIYKIRTMVQDSERLTGARWSTPGDPRVTPFGRFLRATHID